MLLLLRFSVFLNPKNVTFSIFAMFYMFSRTMRRTMRVNPLMPTVSIWVQL